MTGGLVLEEPVRGPMTASVPTTNRPPPCHLGEETMKKTLFATLALALLSQCPQMAPPQPAAPAPPPLPARAASAARAKADEPRQVDQVVVTANRRIETLQSVAGVVQTIDADQLR